MAKEYTHSVEYINNSGDNIYLLQDASPKLFTNALQTMPLAPKEVFLYFRHSEADRDQPAKEQAMMPLGLNLRWNDATFNPAYAENNLTHNLNTHTAREYETELTKKIADGGKFEEISIHITKDKKNTGEGFTVFQKSILPPLLEQDYVPSVGYLTLSTHKSLRKLHKDAELQYLFYHGMELSMTQKTRDKDRKILTDWMNDLASPPRK